MASKISENVIPSTSNETIATEEMNRSNNENVAEVNIGIVGLFYRYLDLDIIVIQKLQ